MKNVVIQEGGVNTTINNVRKLKTDLAEGGTCGWLPEDEISGFVASFVGNKLVLSGNAVGIEDNTAVIGGGS